MAKLLSAFILPFGRHTTPALSLQSWVPKAPCSHEKRELSFPVHCILLIHTTGFVGPNFLENADKDPSKYIILQATWYEISIVALKHTHCTNFLIVQILCLSPPQRRGNFEYVILVLKNNTTVTARGHHMKWIQWIVISYTAFWPVSVQAWKLLLIVFKLKKNCLFLFQVYCARSPGFT